MAVATGKRAYLACDIYLRACRARSTLAHGTLLIVSMFIMLLVFCAHYWPPHPAVLYGCGRPSSCMFNVSDCYRHKSTPT